MNKPFSARRLYSSFASVLTLLTLGFVLNIAGSMTASAAIYQWTIRGSVFGEGPAGNPFASGQPYSLVLDFDGSAAGGEIGGGISQYQNLVSIQFDYGSGLYTGHENAPSATAQVWNDFEEFPEYRTDAFILDVNLTQFDSVGGYWPRGIGMHLMNAVQALTATPFDSGAFPLHLNPADFLSAGANIELVDQAGLRIDVFLTVDSIAIVPIPEPGSGAIGMVAVAAGVMAAMRRTRLKRH